MTMISRVLGFVRDVTIAAIFGAGMGADAFFVAFKIPNFMRRLFGEGAFSQAFVPVLSEYKTRQSNDEVRLLLDRVSGTLGLSLVVVTLLGIIAAPVIVMIFAPGFSANEDKFELTVSLLRITFPYLLFICLTALAGGILNTWGRFGVPAFTPVFLNLSMIAAALFFAPGMEQPAMALAWGVFIGGVVQLAFQIPFLLKLKLLPRPRIKRDDPGVRRILRLMGPAVFGVSVSQINLLIDTLIASFLVTGSVSWLYYSDRLLEFPLGVFAIALGTVILPGLSKQHASGSAQEFSATLDWALRWVMLIALPATLGLMILAGPILTTLFQYGQFSAHDVDMATRSLWAYSLGLTGFTLIKVLAPGYFARQDTRTPVRIGIIAMLSNMVLNVIFVFPLAHAGLALATALSSFINAGLLYKGLKDQGVYQAGTGWGIYSLRLLLANLLLAAVLLLMTDEIAQWLQWGAGERVLHLGLLIISALLTYVVSLWLFGLRPQHMTVNKAQV